MLDPMIRALLAGALLVVCALRPSPAAAQDATFYIFGQGQRIGVETVTVLVTDDGWKVTSTGTLGAPVKLNTRLAEVTYDKAWHPRTFVVDALVDGKASTVKTTFTGTQAANDIVQEERQFQKTDTVDAQTIVMPNLIFGTYEALAARLSTASPGATFRSYVVPQAEISITLGSVSTERVSAPGRTFEARKHALTFANPGGPLAVDLWTDGPRLMRISIPSVGLEVIREDVATVASRTSSHYRANDADVSIGVGSYGFKLAGTLSTPASTAPATRLPAIVLIAGSGPLDRDETVYGIPIFAQLANALADAGFAVVRYDKRGVGQSGGRSEFATLSDYAEDVVAVVKFLEKRKDIDPKRIALAGHSEGAAVALLAARRDGQRKRGRADRRHRHHGGAAQSRAAAGRLPRREDPGGGARREGRAAEEGAGRRAHRQGLGGRARRHPEAGRVAVVRQLPRLRSGAASSPSSISRCS